MDRAARLQATAHDAESLASTAQTQAYEKHLASIAARKKALASGVGEDQASAIAAAADEDATYRAAAEAWKRTADAYQQVETLLAGASPATVERVRWSKSRAMIRSGEIGKGVDELESLLDAFAEEGRGESEIARMTREELATAYYYGARLMRLGGSPAEEWRAVSDKSRQHFRYLAEASRTDGKANESVQNHERNLELVLNLEQSSLVDIQGKALPKDSPRAGRDGLLKGKRKGKTNRPPRQRDDARGAGGAGDLGDGW
jgi:hypothetical protein